MLNFIQIKYIEGNKMAIINYSKRYRRREITLATISGVTPSGVTKNVNYDSRDEPVTTAISSNGQLLMSQEIVKDSYGHTTTLLNQGQNPSRVSIRRDPDNYNIIEHYVDVLKED